MGAALALAERGVGRTAPSPSVGCIIVANGRVVGRGWTQPGGRPHAEAVALAHAGSAARGATAYVTLEPCAHVSARGPDCTGTLVEAGIARVVVAVEDPDPRTAGQGIARLRVAGIEVMTGSGEAAARAVMAGFFARQWRDRPFVTLKLALSIDGCIALASGESRWITGPVARAHAHLERSRHDLIVVGRGTLEADDPALDVRLEGLADRAPRAAVLSRSLDAIPAGRRLSEALLLHEFSDIDALPDVSSVLVEGGAGVAASLLAADRVDRLLVYRAPLLLGGQPGVAALDLGDLASTHGRWRRSATLPLGVDLLEVYDRTR
ncbi:bifunctional diaminohydroxyphosphoribosylaminopyrimidine deaminase/5-amino-6-(5-phosphoribosylamino)uracil reductase RibD [Glacieibacterium sp.]|uniref:bifunctional diaminohydroxyphosphoribosylaminopyrimidine deaminase/5-amino-6-(5-phosphoribosylamino)uracil reductase RibD n=1 Tax=Glacieibacterium sp. TaxID=2860237 RepID=UPI003AFF7DC3